MCPEGMVKKLIDNGRNDDVCQVFYNYQGHLGSEPFMRRELNGYRGGVDQVMNGCPRLTKNPDGTYNWEGCEHAP